MHLHLTCHGIGANWSTNDRGEGGQTDRHQIQIVVRYLPIGVLFGPIGLTAYRGRPEVATGLPLIGTGFTLQDIEVVKNVTLLLHIFQAYSHLPWTVRDMYSIHIPD